jgi:hypothetical protein
MSGPSVLEAAMLTVVPSLPFASLHMARVALFSCSFEGQPRNRIAPMSVLGGGMKPTVTCSTSSDASRLISHFLPLVSLSAGDISTRTAELLSPTSSRYWLNGMLLPAGTHVALPPSARLTGFPSMRPGGQP